MAGEALFSRFRSVLTLQTATETTDGQGGIIRHYMGVADLRAEVSPGQSGQEERDGAIVDVTRATIVMRFRDDIVAGARLVHAGRIYEILSVTPDARQTCVTLDAESISP